MKDIVAETILNGADKNYDDFMVLRCTLNDWIRKQEGWAKLVIRDELIRIKEDEKISGVPLGNYQRAVRIRECFNEEVAKK